jgi:sigma-B regulation protein RsbU (phosphoserine phosphatase)
LLQPGRRRAIALLMNVAGIRDDYEGGIRRGVEQACEAYEFDLYVYAGRSTYDEASEAQRSIYQLVDPTHIDAVIVTTGILASYIATSDLEALIRSYRPLPVVGIGPSVGGIPAVVVDNAAGARNVVEHLIDVHGRRRFVCVSGPLGNPEAVERLAVYRSTLRDRGLELPDPAIEYGIFSEDSGALAVWRLLDQGREFDAVLAANDHMAVGALRALSERGIRCPREVSVVGFDDASTSRYCEPPLTTARQPLARQGAAAVDLVRQLWRGDTVSGNVVLAAPMVVRESCGCGVPDQLGRMTRHDGVSTQDRVAELLGSVLAGPLAAQHALRLAAGLHEASLGDVSTLIDAFQELFAVAVERAVRIDLLPTVVEGVRELLPERSREVEDLFHWAQLDAGRRAYRAQGRRNVEAERTVYDVRLAWERLATALRLDRLAEAMGDELPRQGVRTAVVSVYEDASLQTLVPLVAVHDGRKVEVRPQVYPARCLLPGGWPTGTRRTLSVMPLTFQREQLGVAVLEVGDVGFHDLLREQIGGALKRAAMHEELLRQTRLHARSREEERATAERLKSLHLVAGGVAHDLNNVLGPLVALPEAIRRDLESGSLEDALPAVLEDLDTMQTAAGRASLTIRDLMDLGRPSTGRLERIDLTELLGDAWTRQLEEVVVDRNPGARLAVEVPAAALVVRASESHLERCVTNLVLNAADAVANGGTVTVRVRTVGFTEPYLGFERVEPGGYACIEVEDDGVGIPLAKLHRVVEPFYSDKRRTTTGGTGLGLAIVQRFVKDADGYLDIESEVGVGTTFRIYLPIRRVSSAPARPLPRNPRGTGERILVVDDEPVQRRSAKRVLVALGYQVTCVASGEEALTLFRAPSDLQFDLVILDMVMGDGLDGVETFRRILEERPEQKAMIASGYASEQKGSDAAALGLKWLTKPYTFDALGETVREVLEQE